MLKSVYNGSNVPFRGVLSNPGVTGIESIIARTGTKSLSFVPWKIVDQLYPVDGGDYYCKDTDAMGHVPFTEEYHISLSTVIARHMWTTRYCYCY